MDFYQSTGGPWTTAGEISKGGRKILDKVREYLDYGPGIFRINLGKYLW